jgi:muramoyltetrapeptide carboxypeptidase
MMLQLLHAGVLHNQQAIILGDFSGYKLTDYDNGYDFEAMLAYLRKHIQVPILSGLPFGHVRDKLTLPVGAQCRLSANSEEFSLHLSV